IRRRAPMVLTSIAADHSSSVHSIWRSARVIGGAALLTTMFRALNEARPDRCATAAFKEFVSVTSACTPTTVTPVSPAISWAAARTSCSVRARRATLTPSRARARAMPLPIPCCPRLPVRTCQQVRFPRFLPKSKAGRYCVDSDRQHNRDFLAELAELKSDTVWWGIQRSLAARVAERDIRGIEAERHLER